MVLEKKRKKRIKFKYRQKRKKGIISGKVGENVSLERRKGMGQLFL